MYFSQDISDFLVEEIRGPATFSCMTGQGCRFEEPAMNSLINDIFGDAYITLDCEGGECLHYSQVPGYRVRCFPFAFSILFMWMAYLLIVSDQTVASSEAR